MFPFLSDLLRWFGKGFPTPPFGRPEVFQVTRRRSGTRSARVSWTRHSAERRSPRDAPMVGGWESCGRRGRGVRRPLPEPATGRDCSSRTTSVNHRGPPSMSRRVGYPWPEQMARKMYRNVEKRGAHTARKGLSPPPTPAGGPVAKAEMSTADHLGSRQGSGRAPTGVGRELLTQWVDERVRSLSHRGAVSFKTHF